MKSVQENVRTPAPRQKPGGLLELLGLGTSSNSVYRFQTVVCPQLLIGYGRVNQLPLPTNEFFPAGDLLNRTQLVRRNQCG